MLAALAELSATELSLIAAMAALASVIGGVAGYGTGALMPLVLVPIVGAEPVVPIIAISALPTTMIGAWGYTMLSGRGAMPVIGSMLTLSVPLRRLSRRRGLTLGEGGLAFSSVF